MMKVMKNLLCPKYNQKNNGYKYKSKLSLKKNKRTVNVTNQRKKILYRYYEKSFLEFHLCPLKIFIRDKILIKVVLFSVLYFFIVVQKITIKIKNIFNPNKQFSDKWIVIKYCILLIVKRSI
jgi:hypothetical protein